MLPGCCPAHVRMYRNIFLLVRCEAGAQWYLELCCRAQEEGAFGAAKVVAGAGASALTAVMAAQVRLFAIHVLHPHLCIIFGKSAVAH